MNRIKLAGLLLGVFVLARSGPAAVPSADNPEAWQGLTAEQVRKVKAGEIVIMGANTPQGDETKRFIQAAMILNQPIDTAWALFRQTEKQEQYLSELIKCTRAEDHGNWDKMDFFVKILFVTIKYRDIHHYEPQNYYFYWALDPDFKNDLKQQEGFWRLYKLDAKRTLGRYGTIVQVSDLIPKSVMEVMTKQMLPKDMGAVKKYIDSGGTWAKPGYQK
jgi:hypothetical protein